MEMLDYTGKNLVFVVGCPRSGTTWLQRLLMSHPKIHSGQESNVFDMFVGHQLRMWKLLMSKKEGRPVGLPAYFKESDYKRILKSYLMDLLAPMIGSLPETDYFLEKTPGHALFLDEIKELLPDARFIYILRDVRDVVASLVAASRGWGKSWAPSSVEASAKTWVRYLETVNQFKSKVSADNFFEVRYEQLNSPLAEEVLAQIFQFLKLDYSVEQIKAAIDANRIDKSAKSGGTPIPVFGEFENRFGPVSKEPEGFFRKGKNGAWKEDLTESDLKIIYQIAGKYISDQTPETVRHAGVKSAQISSRFSFRPLLVRPVYPSTPYPNPSLPVGIGYLAQIMEQVGAEYEICDLQIESEQDLLRKISAFDPSHIGFSLMSLDYESHYALIRRIRQFRSDIPIIVGGPHASYIKDAVLDECPEADVVVFHEGEPFMLDMLSGKPLDQITGIAFRRDGQKYLTPPRKLIENLDNLPFPRYAKMNISHYGSRMVLISSRGCPFSCIFCGAHKSMGRKWRANSVARMVEEVRYWYDRGYRRFNFADSNFFMSRDRIIQFCRELKGLDLKIAISSDGMRANDYDEELIAAMKDYALEYVAIGIESANDDILKLIKKGETLDDIRRCMDGLQRQGVDVVAFFILGLPGETVEHVFNSFDFALQYPGISDVHFFEPKPFEGTELFEICQKNGYFLEDINAGRKKGDKIPIATPQLPVSIRQELMKLAPRVKSAVKMQYDLYKQAHKIPQSKRDILVKDLQRIRDEIEQAKSAIRAMANSQTLSAMNPAVQTINTPKTALSEGDPTRQSYHKQHRDVKQMVAQFRSLHVPLEEKTIDVADFMRWMEDFRELTDRYQKMGNVCIEKCLEHYLAAALLGLKPGDNYIDVAGSASNFAEILRKREINAYKLDIAYPKGIHGIQIGADAGNTQLADRSIQGMSLQCAFECFEGDADIRFIQESQRVLKPGGRVVITPLYVDSIYHNITSSLCDQSQIRFDDGALKVWRDDQYKAPFSRHYSPQAFRDRILKQINPDHTYKIIHYTNLDELRKAFPGQIIYCDLLFYLERTSQMAIQSVAPSSDMPSLSVVIPTRNRAASVDRVLNSLVSLQNPGWPYEIIMVDNGSTDTTRQVAESYQQTSLPQLRYVFEPNPGLHNGRHRGAFEARGQVLCYLDDDVKVDPLWLKSVVETFETTGAVLVGGKILPEYEQAPPDWVKEFVKPVGNYGYNIGQLTLIDLGEQIREIDPVYVWGANFSIRKEVLFECGGFRPDSMPKELLDLRGDGETGLSRAIKQKGYKAFYHPRAMVRHCISKDRLTVEYFCARMFSQGISDSFSEIRNAGKLPNPVVSAAWEAYQKGKIHHRQIVQNNPNLLSWITRKDYFSECQSKTPDLAAQSRQKIENKTVQMVAGD